MTLKIATVQLPANEFGLAVIKQYLQYASSENVDIICFPEGYLNGYTRDESQARQMAIDLSSTQFTDILTELKISTVCAIIGVIEIEDGILFNTAVVIKDGKLLGKYRKTHPQEGIFEAGTEFPIFEIKGHKFGINICYDANFPDASQKLMEQGAKIIFFPLNNELQRPTAEKWRNKHIENLVNRASALHAWVVSSDIFSQSANTVGYGCTVIVNPTGEVVERIQELQQGCISVELPQQ